MDSNTVLRYRLCGLPLVGIYDRRKTMKEYLEVFFTALGQAGSLRDGSREGLAEIKQDTA